MRTLKGELSRLLPDVTSLGDEGRNIDRERLVRVLDGLSSDLNRGYWIRIVDGAIVLVVLLVLAGQFAAQPAVLTGLASAMGVTVAGTFALLKQVTDEMPRVRLLLAIVPEISLEELTEMARKLVATL
jgi:hypothetical protein